MGEPDMQQTTIYTATRDQDTRDWKPTFPMAGHLPTFWRPDPVSGRIGFPMEVPNPEYDPDTGVDAPRGSVVELLLLIGLSQQLPAIPRSAEGRIPVLAVALPMAIAALEGALTSGRAATKAFETRSRWESSWTARVSCILAIARKGFAAGATHLLFA